MRVYAPQSRCQHASFCAITGYLGGEGQSLFLFFMRRLQVGTGSELDLDWVRPKVVNLRSLDAAAWKLHLPDELTSKTSALGRA